MSGQIEAPDQEVAEGEISVLFKYGELKKVAKEARIPYDTFTKQTNPNAIEESIPYQFLYYLYAAHIVREELAEDIWNVVARHRPRRDPEPASFNTLDIAWFNYRAKLVERVEGLCSQEQVEEARDRLAEIMARTGRPERSGTEGAS